MPLTGKYCIYIIYMLVQSQSTITEPEPVAANEWVAEQLEFAINANKVAQGAEDVRATPAPKLVDGTQDMEVDSPQPPLPKNNVPKADSPVATPEKDVMDEDTEANPTQRSHQASKVDRHTAADVDEPMGEPNEADIAPTDVDEPMGEPNKADLAPADVDDPMGEPIDANLAPADEDTVATPSPEARGRRGSRSTRSVSKLPSSSKKKKKAAEKQVHFEGGDTPITDTTEKKKAAKNTTKVTAVSPPDHGEEEEDVIVKPRRCGR